MTASSINEPVKPAMITPVICADESPPCLADFILDTEIASDGGNHGDDFLSGPSVPATLGHGEVPTLVIGYKVICVELFEIHFNRNRERCTLLAEKFSIVDPCHCAVIYSTLDDIGGLQPVPVQNARCLPADSQRWQEFAPVTHLISLHFSSRNTQGFSSTVTFKFRDDVGDTLIVGCVARFLLSAEWRYCMQACIHSFR